MDKMLFFIIIFLVVSISMAAVLAMGAIPQIFKSAEKIRETQQLVNQTQIELHEDEAREKQSRDLLKHIESIALSNNKELERFIERQNNTTHKILQNQELMLDGLIQTTEQNLNLSKQHELVQEDHNTIQNIINNLTVENYELNKETLEILEKHFNVSSSNVD